MGHFNTFSQEADETCSITAISKTSYAPSRILINLARQSNSIFLLPSYRVYHHRLQRSERIACH